MRKTHRAIFLTANASQIPQPIRSATSSGQEIASRIASALSRLSPRERVVFEMKHYQGLKLRAIGDALGTSEETVKNSLFRATRKLRGQLGELV